MRWASRGQRSEREPLPAGNLPGRDGVEDGDDQSPSPLRGRRDDTVAVFGASDGLLVTGYEISVIGERTDEVTTVTVGGDLVHTEVVALVPGDSYQAGVTAINAAGEGPMWALPHQRSLGSVAER